MSPAQGWLIVGGLFNLFVSVLIAYALYWIRVAHPGKPSSHAGLTSHKVTLWSGFLLLGLAAAIEYTNFDATVNTWLAAAQVIATLLAGGRRILTWMRGVEDQFAEGPELQIRFTGLGHILDLLVISGVLYGVARTAFGLW